MKRPHLLPLLLCFLVISAWAQPGSNDLSFNPSDLGNGLGQKFNSYVWSSATQSNGKIVVVGNFTSYDGVRRKHIVRINEDGTLDETFDVGVGPSNPATDVAIQSDGKILVAGIFNQFNEQATDYLVRLNTDGTLDSTFNTDRNAQAGDEIYAIAVQQDQKILISRGYHNHLIRLNTDGTIDNSFDAGIMNNVPKKILPLSNGDIFIGGDFDVVDGVTRHGIARLNSDGSVDAGFSTGVDDFNEVEDIELLENGDMLIACSKKVVKLHADGTKDAGFNAPSRDGNYYALAVQNDGKIVCGGDFSFFNGRTKYGLERLNADGSKDTGFLSDGVSEAYPFVRVTEILSTGKILIGGNFFAYNGVSRRHIAVLNVDGSVSGELIPSKTSANGAIHAIVPLAGGKLLMGGEFGYYDTTPAGGIIRLNANGTPDATFNVGTGANGPIYSIAVQQDGKMLVGGIFTNFNGAARENLARINADGSLDDTFNPDVFQAGEHPYDNPVGAIVIDGNGKILYGTDYVYRVLSDGTADPEFLLNFPTTGLVKDIVIQQDGKIVVGGSFIYYHDVRVNGLVRLNSDGTFDNTFIQGTGLISNFGEPVVTTIAQQTDGKLLLGGDFSHYNGVEHGRLLRLYPDGTLDVSFPSGVHAYDDVYTITLMPDNKIFIGGAFQFYDQEDFHHAKRMALLNPDGSMDESFVNNPGANGNVYVSALLADGKIMIGGNFTNVNGTGRHYITRLWMSCEAEVAVDAPVITSNHPEGICKGGTATLTAEGNLPLGSSWKWYQDACNGVVVGSANQVNVSSEENVTYFVRAEGGCVTPGTCTTFELAINFPKITSVQGDSTCTGHVTLRAEADADSILWYTNTWSPSFATGNAIETNVLGNHNFLAQPWKHGCMGEMDTVSAFYLPTPDAMIDFVNGELMALSSVEGVTFQWVHCNDTTEVVGETGPTFQVTESGNYRAVVDKDGCAAYTECRDLVVTNAERATDGSVQVYPNPNNGMFSISLGSDRISGVLIRDVSGATIYDDDIIRTGDFVFTFPNHRGFFLLELKSAAGKRQVKLMIE